MKILKKDEFIPFLKGIINVLEKNKIKYDIPFCHIDKIEFNHIYIIIPDVINVDDLNAELSFTFLKEKNGIIYTEFDGFSVNFVKTSEEMWGYTFHYYCWNALPFLINSIALFFNMQYTRNGLIYVYNDRKILLSKNLKEIFDFLYLKFNFLSLGFPTDFTIFEYIQSSPYYDTKLFIHDNFKDIDSMYEFNKKYYNDFIKIKREMKAEHKDEAEKLALIDAYFKKVNFIERLYTIQLKEENSDLKEIPNIPVEDRLKKVTEMVIEYKRKKRIKLSNFFKPKNEKKDDSEFKWED